MRNTDGPFPLLIDAEGNLIAGHGRLEAAKSIGIETVPVVRKTDISEEQVRAYRIADNRLADLGTWNTENLKLEMQELSVAGFNLGKIGFTPGAASKIGNNIPKSPEDASKMTESKCPHCGR